MVVSQPLDPVLRTAAPLPRGTAVRVPDSLLVREPRAEPYDVVILGAGCSALSLCLALVENGATGPILLIDSRTQYADDRTWSFWDVESTRFSHLARASWGTWRVRTEGDDVHSSAPSTPYLSLAANDFYRYALGRLAEHPNVELLLGEPVAGYRRIASGYAATTRRFTARGRRIADARGLRPSPDEVAAIRSRSTWIPQAFVGLHIVARKPVFDDGEAVLMDFDVDRSRGLRFGYVLPVSNREALVENVYLSDAPVTLDEHRSELRAYLLERYGLEEGDFEVLAEERGVIPMTDHAFSARPSPGAAVVGTLGGATRPSTGYTFLRIQRASDETALRLLGRGRASARDSRCSLLDRVFLRFLADRPEEAPEVFALMFRRLPPDALVRFLSDRSRPADIARLIAALPKRTFLVAAGRTVLGLLRRGVVPAGGVVPAVGVRHPGGASRAGRG